MTDTDSSLEIAHLRNAFLGRAISAIGLAEQVLARIAQSDDPAIWIPRSSEEAVRARARELDAQAAVDPSTIAKLPLFGIPFAVKDNIDVAGVPTTAGCPAFAYIPVETAPVVARLLAAGAVLLGKTNLDQFATGLVGTRSPYGIPRNPYDARFIPGGSSSGSAVAVAAGLVSFSLGTDTAGSGRIPAAFNNLVGLKPTRGLLSTRGIVPACRSLDCVSVFALTPRDASTVFDIAGFFDPDDPLAREPNAAATPSFGPHFRFGVPRSSELEFFGDSAAAELFDAAIVTLETTGGTRVEVNLAPFRDSGRLLYEGPWVAERLHATQALLSKNPDALLPVILEILEGGSHYTALDAYRAQYELAALRRLTDTELRTADVLLLPTAGTIYTTAAVAAEPKQLNSNLGLYTNFVNLLDLSAIAVPAGFGKSGLPFGISFVAPAYRDAALLDLGIRFQQAVKLRLDTGAI
jgi:allophanate hydrolase